MAVVLSTAGTLSEAHNAQNAPLQAVTNQIDPEAGLHDHPAPRAVSAAIWRYPGREEVKAIILAYFPNGPACPMTRMARAMTQGDGEYERRLWRSMRKATWKLKSSRTIHPTSSLTSMADACVRQMYRLATSAKELLNESVAHDEIEAELKRALQAIASRGLSR